jgi:hypothetical protein
MADERDFGRRFPMNSGQHEPRWRFSQNEPIRESGWAAHDGLYLFVLFAAREDIRVL